jgi:ribokinase
LVERFENRLQMKKPSIVVIGSATVDLINRLPRLPKEGETVAGGVFSTAPGGKGANQAVAAARAGANVCFVGKVGNDDYGRQSLEGYALEGIDARWVAIDHSSATGIGVIFVLPSGQNAIGVALGANMKLTPEDVQKAEHEIANSDLVLFQLETPIETVTYGMELARKYGKRVLLNPAPAQKIDRSLLKLCSVITPNESETEMLTDIPLDGEANMVRAAKALETMGAKSVLLTLGSKGVYVHDPSFQGFIRVHEVQAVDATAAGDVFSGTLAVALAEGKDLESAARFANTAAALSVTKLGAQPSIPYRPEIEQLLQVKQT